MRVCEQIEECPFYNELMIEQPVMTGLYKVYYCLCEDHVKCARYMVRQALGDDRVPGNLYPNQKDKAQALIMIRQGACK